MKRTSKAFLLAVVLVAALSTVGSANYTTATITAIDPPLPDGSIHLIVTCKGDAGEPDVPTDFTLRGGVGTLLELRTQAWQACDAANRSANIKKLLTVGQNVPRPPAPAAPTACDTFALDLAKWHRVNTAIQAGILTGVETEVVALKNQVKGEYAPACLANF